jgi:indole-3-glycerol phosphate synthase
MTTSVDSKVPMGMLNQMVDAAKRDVVRRQAAVPIATLESKVRDRTDPRPFREALTRSGLSVIAEFKRRSPSMQSIASASIDANVAAYQRGGAAALSVLTDEEHFEGTLTDLFAAREASDLPILRKDFTVDRYQLYEAVVFGADAVLLIASVLDPQTLADFYREAQALDLDCIVEVRNPEEVEVALDLDADIIGINNRDLQTLEIDFEKTFELMKPIPTGKTVVSESGIETRQQIDELRDAGVDAVLIGHFLMEAQDPESQLRNLTGADEGTREHLF